jgi:pSer/pThr/pTyr-binding forkhead associated (FHA) protein
MALFDLVWHFRYVIAGSQISSRQEGEMVMPKLHILSPSSVARTIDLTDNLLTIGRTAETDICIPDHNISKRHGILVRDGDDYQLHDFKSTNGTFVDGKRIMAVKLQHGVSIRLGAVELQYESTPANAGLSSDRVTVPGSKPAEQPALLASGGGRGMAKRGKPEYAAGSLQPGSFAKPIPPPSSKTTETEN